MNMKNMSRILPIKIISLTTCAPNTATATTYIMKANSNKRHPRIFIPPKIYLVAPQIIIIMKTTTKIQPNAIAALTKNAIVETNNTAAVTMNIMKANSNKRHPHIFIPPKNQRSNRLDILYPSITSSLYSVYFFNRPLQQVEQHSC